MIDWNACILLSPPDKGTGYVDLHDIKAQLPRGVDNVRSHLENVDDIPMHVSLFAECNASSVREMIKIFQDQGEVVCVVGSSMNLENTDCFSIADIAVALDPVNTITPGASRFSKDKGVASILSAGSMFSTIPCAVSLQYDTSIYSLSQLIREARTLGNNSMQVYNCSDSVTGLPVLYRMHYRANSKFAFVVCPWISADLYRLPIVLVVLGHPAFYILFFPVYRSRP